MICFVTADAGHLQCETEVFGMVNYYAHRKMTVTLF